MITFTTGLNGHQTIDYEPGKLMTCSFANHPILQFDSLRESMQHDVKMLGNKKIAVFFSGGLDSEIVLEICKDVNADFYAIFCLYTFKGLPVNVHELYYVEKYCRENVVDLKIIDLDLEWFFHKDKYLKYVQLYHCNIAQICPYMWFIDQVNDCCILGGDTPTVPPLVGQVSVERMFAMQQRDGIPNFLTHSCSTLQWCFKLWEQQKIDDPWDYNNPMGKKFSRWAYTTMKHGMYKAGGFDSLQIKPKFSSPFALCADFDITRFDRVAAKIVPHCRSEVTWHPTLQTPYLTY